HVLPARNDLTTWAESSVDTQRNATSFSRGLPARLTIDGNSMRQGPHHVAQRLRKIARPRNFASSTGWSSRSRRTQPNSAMAPAPGAARAGAGNPSSLGAWGPKNLRYRTHASASRQTVKNQFLAGPRAGSFIAVLVRPVPADTSKVVRGAGSLFTPRR